MTRIRLGLVLAALGLLAFGLAVWAAGVGSTPLPPGRLWAALRDGGTREGLILRDVRAPRVLAALLVGAALATAGAIMQRLTRNPLAEPGLLGINAGAAFGVVLVSVLAGIAPRGALVWAAFGGGALASALVWALGATGRGGDRPIRLVLAGVVVGSFLMSLTSALLIFDAATLDGARIWTAGSLAGIRMNELLGVAPWVVAGLLAALLTARHVELLGLGADTARALGLDLRAWQLAAAATVVLLAGGAVSLAGPIAFLGLVVPHAVRLATGAGFRALLRLSLVSGAVLALLADTLPRALLARDVPMGISVALLGAPVFIWLARRTHGAAR